MADACDLEDWHRQGVGPLKHVELVLCGVSVRALVMRRHGNFLFA